MITRTIWAQGRWVVGCMAVIAGWAATAAPLEISSPDGRLMLGFHLGEIHGETGCPVYSLSYQGRKIVQESRLGLVLRGGPDLDRNLRLLNSGRSTHDSAWKPVAAERSEIRDHYNQLVVDLADSETPAHELRLTFRVYDEGAAFCYTLPRQAALGSCTIAGEVTEFCFDSDYLCWPVYSAQGVYSHKPLSQVGSNCERPLVIEIKEGPTIAIGEARLVDYSRMRLKNEPGHPLTLVPDLAGPVRAATPFTSPWRFVMVGDSPGQLIERDYFVMDLNAPCAIPDTSWIKPGKVIREVTLSTKGGLACVDFAVKAGLQYIEYDAGWYGPENSADSDARFVNVNPNRPQGGLDLRKVIAYAREHGIGVILYVNHKALERQLDQLLPVYEKWGVKGLKFGFVNVGSQKWTAWLHEAVRKCAAAHLVADIHDEYRPTGWSRTYPNLLTQEGVRGNEEMPPPWHNAVLPFTRFLCGPADCTICWYDKRIKTTHAHQLAASIVFFSPLQFLFWYDRPAQCRWEPELALFKHVPTAWDETRVLHGVIGQYVTIARRKGDEWFVGTLNAVKRRELDIPLSFLEPRRRYTAWIYSDAAPDGSAPMKVDIKREQVNARTVLRADLAHNGGQAIRIAPETAVRHRQ